MKTSRVAWALALALGAILVHAAPRAHAAADKVPPIPKEWVLESDIGAEKQFAGLTPMQRYLALKVINTKPCDCGCPLGPIAKCKKQDPNCPAAPAEIEIATREARAGKSYDEIYNATRRADEADAAKPQRVQLGAWTPVRGPKYAKVTIVEFSDFQCPYCGKVVPVVRELEKIYGNKLRVAFRHQPLPFHPFAMGAAEAAMAANAQGKFWPMHDLLFAHQHQLDREALDGYAKQIGLDMAKYRAAMDGHTYQSQIEDDAKAGDEVGASGTPAFFVNGQPLPGAVPLEMFRAVIDAELEKAETLVKKGVPMNKLYEAELAALPQ